MLTPEIWFEAADVVSIKDGNQLNRNPAYDQIFSKQGTSRCKMNKRNSLKNAHFLLF